jgi:hypothetical protein
LTPPSRLIFARSASSGANSGANFLSGRAMLNTGMADRAAYRRAAQWRNRARELTVAAEREPKSRRHLLDQAASYERAADEMAPLPSGQEKPARN